MSVGDQAGESFARYEPPDIFVVGFVGDVDGALMRRMSEDLSRIAQGKPRVFLLMDHTRVGSISADARALAAEVARGLPIAGAASFGASFHVRVVAMLIARVNMLVRGDRGDLLRFFSDEAEARAWIAERRSALE